MLFKHVDILKKYRHVKFIVYIKYSMKYDRTKPFNELPCVPPKCKIATEKILKKAILAGRILAELKGSGDALPDQNILINSIVLQEAKASSEIENIVTTNDSIYKAFSTDKNIIDIATKEVIKYRQALWEGFNSLKKKPFLNTNHFIKIVQTIKQNKAGIRNLPGTAISNSQTEEMIYTPPTGEKIIRDKLKNLEDYINIDDGTDPLIKSAIIHYQFEAIHPFFDGNGRTGRIISILYLTQQNLLKLPILYLSRYIIENKSKYYNSLRLVTEEMKWEQWILYMLNAIENTAHFTLKKIEKIKELLTATLTKAKQSLPKRIYSKELIEILFNQPYTKNKNLIEAGIAKRQTAAEYLKELEKIGILSGTKYGKEMIYLNNNLYKLLAD